MKDSDTLRTKVRGRVEKMKKQIELALSSPKIEERRAL